MNAMRTTDFQSVPGAGRLKFKKLDEISVAYPAMVYTIAMGFESFSKRGSEMVPLRCSGWWEQEGYGRQAMRDLRLFFSNGKISAEGSDMVGSFEMTGSLTQNRIYLFKQYLGKHFIEYHGESIGEGLYTGEWTCYGHVGGKWLIRIERTAANDSDSSADIHEWSISE